jgi:hypothetical protein
MNQLLVQAALRVLTCTTQYQHPSEEDEHLLRAYSDHQDRDRALDELACDIIRREIAAERRVQTRSAAD